jgi:NAD-dependent SIR2 family protein deacetylase
MAGVPDDLLVECHGHFRTASCIRCKKATSIESVKECIVVRKEVPICTHCTKKHAFSKHKPAYIKPDIVFFGESLPDRFHETLPSDVDMADLCIILGTSLQVPPSALIPDMVHCKRILLNRELVGNLNISGDDDSDDVYECGNCDDSILSIARILGWDQELYEKHGTMKKKFKSKLKVTSSNVE